MIKKIAAHYILPIKDKPIKNGLITFDDSGKILEISQSSFPVQEIAGVEFYAGILVPGFINTHCHLELSHMKSVIPMHTGLHGFVSKISANREADKELIYKAAKNADIRMWHNGIAAVGDISNNELTFEIKKNSKIHYHTFLEIFSTIPEMAQLKFDSAQILQKKLNSMNLASSIVPHAPYSVSPEMFKLINNNALKIKQPISMHNQESMAENELFHSKSGKLYEALNSLGVNFDAIPLSGKNSLPSVMHQIDSSIPTILVHNTYSAEADILLAAGHFKELYLAICVNANLYIENTLPDIDLFRKLGQKITIGTDSLASNNQLSVIEELKTISKHFPNIPPEELFKWASINGAEALGFSDRLGSFEPGKTPGINLITHFDLNNFRFRPDTAVKRLA